MQLTPLELPVDDDSWAQFVAGYADSGLDRARELIATLKDGSTRSATEVLALWNDLDNALGRAMALTVLMSNVHPDEGVRTVAREREQDVARMVTDRDLDRELYDVLVAVDPTGLDEISGRALERSLRDFRRSGVDRDETVRDRLRALSERITELAQDFSRNIADDVRSIQVEPERLAGLPDDFIAERPVNDAGLVTVTTEYPDYVPVRTFAVDASVRRQLSQQFLNRGWPANDEVLGELLQLRAERAQLLGYDSWPAYDAETKMIKTSEAIAAFIDQVTEMAEPSARRDLDVLVRRRQDDVPDATGLDSADSYFYSEIVRRENYDVDAQLVRRYFDFSQVRAGLLDVTGRLFGLEYRERPDAPVWHPDVTSYDVYSTDGSEDYLGRIYLDLHPRAGKFSHAAQFDVVPGLTGRQLPEGALVCNVPRGLMEHGDVVMLFHEFGHLVHHVLAGRQDWVRFSGVTTEWDFVEAPSQMLEEWAWNAEILRSFAIDASGEAIPPELVERMRAAKDFGKGLATRTQMFYAAISYRLHLECPADITATSRALQAKYDLIQPVEDTHFFAAFGHLEGYSSGYYTYMWSLVIAKDLFSAFSTDDMFDVDVAHRYRDEILVPGGSGDAADLVESFLGRPYALDSFSRWLLDPVGP
jgi:thimet oligopeptidase